MLFPAVGNQFFWRTQKEVLDQENTVQILAYVHSPEINKCVELSCRHLQGFWKSCFINHAIITNALIFNAWKQKPLWWSYCNCLKDVPALCMYVHDVYSYFAGSLIGELSSKYSYEGHGCLNVSFALMSYKESLLRVCKMLFLLPCPKFSHCKIMFKGFLGRYNCACDSQTEIHI